MCGYITFGHKGETTCEKHVNVLDGRSDMVKSDNHCLNHRSINETSNLIDAEGEGFVNRTNELLMMLWTPQRAREREMKLQ